MLVFRKILRLFLMDGHKMVQPAAIRDVYYLDEFGIISTSNMLINDSSVKVELQRRSTLFG